MNRTLPSTPIPAIEPPAPTPTVRLASIHQVCDQHPALTPPALRSLIHRADENGLRPHIYKIGRRVLVDLIGFEQWLLERRGDV